METKKLFKFYIIYLITLTLIRLVSFEHMVTCSLAMILAFHTIYSTKN